MRNHEHERIARFNSENGGSTMLILSRKSRESVVIGGADGFHRLLRVTVLEINGGKVKLGFDVDASIPVHRAEVWERIRVHDQSGSAAVASAAPVFHTELRGKLDDGKGNGG
jgi:carbon storage regulator CsrA